MIIPFSYLDVQNQPVGYDIEVDKKLAHAVGIRAVFVKTIRKILLTDSEKSLRHQYDWNH